MKWRRLSLDS